MRNQMKMEIDMALGQLALPRSGLVSSYDPARYAVKVRLMPEDVETGWLQLAAGWVGNGWGMFAPPSIGDQVAVLFFQGSYEAGYAVCRFFNDVDVPLAVASGEFWLVHQAGGFVKLHNDGSIEINAPGNLTATAPTATLNANVQINGTLSVTKAITGQQTIAAAGNISSGADIADKTGSMQAMRSTYNSHKHTDPQGGTTDVPNSTM